jgi:hypothetical protein
MGDDFSYAVKTAFAARVGYLCSNPDCRALTSGPQEDSAKATGWMGVSPCSRGLPNAALDGTFCRFWVLFIEGVPSNACVQPPVSTLVLAT